MLATPRYIPRRFDGYCLLISPVRLLFGPAPLPADFPCRIVRGDKFEARLLNYAAVSCPYSYL